MKTPRVLLVILALALCANLAMQVNSYPGIRSGGAECLDCHNEPISTEYDSTTEANVNLDIDGDDDDIFWDDNARAALYIPIGNYLGDGHVFEFVRTYFAQNSTHVFFMVRVHDSDYDVVGTDNPYYGSADKLAFLWNINASTTGQGFGSGMSADIEEGEAVDLWMFSPAAADNTNGSDTVYFDAVTYDGSYVSGAQANDTNNDLEAAVKYTTNAHGGTMDYFYEIVRPLTTDDDTDVQFDHSGFYEFSIAVWDESNGASHHVSFSHYLWVTEPVNDISHAPYDNVVTTTTETVQDVDEEEVEVVETVDVTVTVDETVVTTVVVDVVGDTITSVINQDKGDETTTPLNFGFFLIGLTLVSGVMVYTRRRS
ncbi:MAG: hypothetical protein INQ03_23180 [Candidatus Heimdallarchaeota archaeon]|nr:hypothetical protein [Candidatus Heimdallarchaeota archaeon]